MIYRMLLVIKNSIKMGTIREKEDRKTEKSYDDKSFGKICKEL